MEWSALTGIEVLMWERGEDGLYGRKTAIQSLEPAPGYRIGCTNVVIFLGSALNLIRELRAEECFGFRQCEETGPRPRPRPRKRKIHISAALRARQKGFRSLSQSISQDATE